MKFLKKLTLENILRVLLVLCFVGTCIVILKGSRANLHSDTATAVLLAREQIRTGQLLPSTWNYGQDIWILSLNILVLPFLFFIKDMVLCREIAVIIQTTIIVVLMYQLMKRLVSKEAGLLGAIAVLLPISASVTEYYYYQATYNSQGMEMMVVFLLLISAMRKDCPKKQKIIYNVLLFLWLVNLNANGTRYLAVLVLPLLCALILYVLLETNFDFVRGIKEYKPYLQECAVILAGAFVGLLVYKYLAGHLNFFEGQADMNFCTAKEAANKILTVIAGYFTLYGAAGLNGILTIRGMLIFLKFVYMVMCCIVIPIVFAKTYKKIEQPFQKIILLFSGVVAVIVLYLLVFGSLVGNERYLIVLYFCNILLFGMFYENVVKQNIGFTYMAILCFFVPLSLGSYVTWTAYTTIATHPNISSNENLQSFLREHNLYYGYTDYWLSYSNTVLSNGEFELIALTSPCAKPDLWLNSSEYFSQDFYNGRTFVMYPTINDARVNQKLKDASVEQYVFEAYTVLVYDKNILCDPSISTPFPSEAGQSVTYDANTPGMYTDLATELYTPTEDGTFKTEGKVGAIAAGPTLDLEPGTYTIEAQISVTKMTAPIAGRLKLSGNMGGKEIASVDFGISDTKVVLENVVVDKTYKFAEVRVNTVAGTSMTVHNITVTKVK